MFTGIITDVGEVVAVEPRAEGLRRLEDRLRLSARESIADRRVDRMLRRLPDRGRNRRGRRPHPVSVDAAAETLRLTTAGAGSRARGSTSNAR